MVIVVLVVAVALLVVVTGSLRTRPDGGKWIRGPWAAWGPKPRGIDGKPLDPSAPSPKPSSYNEDSSEYTGD